MRRRTTLQQTLLVGFAALGLVCVAARPASAACVPAFVNGVDITSTEGVLFSGTVGTSHCASTVTVSWGDGSSSPGTVAANGDISASYTYQFGGTYVITLNTDVGFATATATVADQPLGATGIDFAGTEGGLFSGTVATFIDGNPDSQASDFSVVIDWGDGVMSPGAVAGNVTGYSVSASHTYVVGGSYMVTTNILDLDGGSTATAHATATIADVPITLVGVPISGAASTPFSGVVGMLTDPNPFSIASNFTATIDWGDGTATTTGSVAGGGGSYAVSGSHTYSMSGGFMLQISVSEVGGSMASASATATISAAPDGGPADGGSGGAGDGAAADHQGGSDAGHAEDSQATGGRDAGASAPDGATADRVVSGAPDGSGGSDASLAHPGHDAGGNGAHNGNAAGGCHSAQSPLESPLLSALLAALLLWGLALGLRYRRPRAQRASFRINPSVPLP